MKRYLTKVVALVLACISLMCLATIGASAESITVSHQYNSAFGYSDHDEYSSSSHTWGYSEGDCVYNSQGNFYYSAYVNKGTLNYAHLYSYAKAVNGTITTYYNGTVQSNINKTSQNVTFNFTMKTNIIMEEMAYTGVDMWRCKYDYLWNYYSPESSMSLISGTYTSL